MNELFTINKEFLLKSYFWISGIFTCGFLLYLWFFYSETSSKWIFVILFMTIVGCPLIVIGAWVYDWFRKRKYIERILQQEPFSELDRLGFDRKTLLSNHNSLKDYVRFAEINNTEIIFNVSITKPNVAEFSTYCSTFNLTNQEFSQKFKELKHKNIELGMYSLVKKIDTRKEKISIQNLEAILSDLTQLVKINRFEPIRIENWEKV